MTLGAPSPKKKGQGKKQKRPVSFCWVCLHNPPMGKCLVCGFSKGKGGVDPKFTSRFEWLQQTHRQLRRYNQRSTGNPDLDIEIYKKFSGWGAGMVPFRDEATFKVEYLYHNSTLWEMNPEEGALEWDQLDDKDHQEIKDDYTLPSWCPYESQSWRRKYPRPRKENEIGENQENNSRATAN